MENLDEFVTRFSNSVGCYYHQCKTRIFSLKRVDANIRGKMGVFGWVGERIRKNLFIIQTYKYLGDKAGVSGLADEVQEGGIFIPKKKDPEGKGTAINFYVRKDSHGEDYQKAVRAFRAILPLRT